MKDSAKDTILAIESSCDETAVCWLDSSGRILLEALSSQIELHRKTGGVVPEVASRSHFEVINHLVQGLLQNPVFEVSRLRAIAATRGPGLVGPLLVGASYAEGQSTGWKLPFVGVHHLRGHLASALLPGAQAAPQTLKERADHMFPALVLLVSGGHTQVLEVDSQLRARKWIDTVDDAAGECFDKSAKLMGLPYPGGPEIEALALRLPESSQAEAKKISKHLPKPKTQDGNFSFSGLKTAVRNQLEKNPSYARSPAFCWALQDAIGETLVAGLTRALKSRSEALALKSLVFCGGVSANRTLRTRIETWAQQNQMTPHCPPLKFCTDNAAMIAAAAFVQHESLALHRVAARLELV